MKNNRIKVRREIRTEIWVAILAILALGACYFFRGCKYDLLVTILGMVTVFSGTGSYS
ncbi:MAG: hypothetical protein J6X36_01000 [Lachnospiraceae bacterium]|nr:hypothetical protein [Lachnospiraceae bacterium]